MRVVVTGGAGYIGSVVVPRLAGAGHDVRVVDTMIWGRPATPASGNVDLVEADVCELDGSILAGFDAVLHLAGISSDPSANLDPDLTWRTNVEGTAHVARLCREQGIGRVVYAGSCSLYDTDPARNGVADEDAPVRPWGSYSRSKAAAEQVLQSELRDGEPVLLRQGTVFGPSPRMRFDLVLNAMARDALVTGTVNVTEGGWMSRPLVSVDDLGGVYLAALTAPAAAVAHETFNVIESNYRIRDLAEVVCEELQAEGGQVSLRTVPAAGRTRNYRCSGDKLARRLGVPIDTTPRDGIRHLLAAYRSVDPRELTGPQFSNVEWLKGRAGAPRESGEAIRG